MNQYLSTSREFDDVRFYQFARQSGLPHGTFDEPRRWNALCIVCVAAAVLAVVFLIVTK